MTEFDQKLRHMCRSPKCRSKLPAPVANDREAFCTRGCYNSFYLHRCRFCEQPIEQPRSGQRFICKRAKCRNAWQRRESFGRFATTTKAPEVADRGISARSARKTALKSGHEDCRELPGGQWAKLPRDYDDWMLLDREGRRAAIIRQCDDQYRVTRPHCRPYTPRESWVGAKRRAVQLAMAVLDRAPGQPSSWSENERHTVPPGMTPRQYQETCRDRRRRHPNWSDDQIAAHTKHALQPNEHLAPMLPVQPVPFTKTADVDAAPLINSIPEDVSIRRPCGPRSHDRGAAA